MKASFKYIIRVVLAAALFSACTKLDVPVENELTPETFPKTAEQYVLASGAVYSKFREAYAISYWQLQSLSTDEAILPTRGSNWYDGGRYQQLHYHNWTPDHPLVAGTWSWGFGTISVCNQVLSLFDQSPDTDAKLNIAAEVRTMRALSLYLMMDLYGNIPVSTTFGDKQLPSTKNRKEVFAFIEQEIKAVLPRLSTTTGGATYGRPTKYTAFALLAKMYLNSGVYTGTDRSSDAVSMCDSIIQSGKFSLADDYAGMFRADNGPATKEFIFAIPYDQAQATGQRFTWYGLHYALQTKYGLSFRISGPVSTLPEYYANFDNTSADVRNKVWLTGKQYDNSGNPVLINTTKKGLDATYAGADGSAPVTYQLEFTPNVTIINTANFDAGSDVLASAKGIRNIKYAPDVAATTRDASNDVPVFRYADILLMKAEAILRGANVTNGETALVLVNQLRAKRNSTSFTSINLDELLRERARELNWESWRRNDLIRFGKFENSWGYKTDADPNKRLYPVPSGERILNPNLVQNTGY
ncbi:RagB/SusD family nutrient uptake outer membrane protein [Chitinophaga sp. 212800010-3]|uniref:RagB/SusD family nutrient uptake outer membrane protein n=1 Tax=unclassified Chitinophaga TaxID=2619133 RepID=UPI002DF19764|nr:RagB/SusD family nutrient uptake outer membrane protein [Chitinophaga sp. 212800010-3]